MPSRKQTKDGINCGNCNRFLPVEEYSGLRPSAETPPDHVHFASHPPLRNRSFLCPCGHYTVTNDGCPS